MWFFCAVLLIFYSTYITYLSLIHRKTCEFHLFLLQFHKWNMFIIFILQLLFFFFFFYCFSYLLSIYILSSQYRYSIVNVVLIINDSLIFFAPSPILVTVHYFHFYNLFIFHYYFIIIIYLYIIITSQIKLSQCSINH